MSFKVKVELQIELLNIYILLYTGEKITGRLQVQILFKGVINELTTKKHY